VASANDSWVSTQPEIWEIVRYKISFCEDPFGNIIEILDHSYGNTIISL
jgi:hypothetical protein